MGKKKRISIEGALETKKKTIEPDRASTHFDDDSFSSSTSSLPSPKKKTLFQVEASDKSLSARVTELEQAVARLSNSTSTPSSS